MPRLTLFAKGNIDVHSALHAHRVNGEIVWNGVNAAVETLYPGVRVRVALETATGSRMLAAADGRSPPGVAERDPWLKPHPAAMQFSDAIYRTRADAIILSIMPDVTAGLLDHRSGDYSLYAGNIPEWPIADRQWLAREFTGPRLASVDEASAHWRTVIERIRDHTPAPILVFNMSPFTPGDPPHCFLGLDDDISTRIREFNLALVRLSRETGISIVDVEGVVGRAGAERASVSAVHLSALGYELVARAVVRILGDYGLFDGRGEGSPSA